MRVDLREKYTKMPLPAKASIWFVICSVVQKGIAFLTTPIFTRLLTTDEYGMVSIFNSWHSILTMVLTLQLSSGVFYKAMVKYEKERDAYTSSMLFLTSCLTVIGYIIYFPFRKPLNAFLGMDTWLTTAVFIEIFFSEAISFWSIRHRFEYEYKTVIGYTLLSSVLGTAVSLALVVLMPEHRVYAKVGGTLIIWLFILCCI